MDDDLDYLSNLLSADIESDCVPQLSSQDENTTSAKRVEKTAGKRKLTEDDTFIKELEENVKKKKKKIEDLQAKRCEDLIKKHFGDLSDDEDNEYAIFTNDKSDKKESNFYPIGLSNKTTWKSKVDTSKPAPTLNQSEKFDVYAEPVFGMRIINPLISMQDLKYKMTGRQPIPMHKIKQHVTSPDVDSIDWIVGGVLVGKSLPKTSAKGSQYCIWTLSDLKSGLKTVSLFLFSSAFTALWKSNVGTVLGVLNPSVMENSRSQEEACLSVNNSDKVMIWGTSKDFGKCKARKKDGENCSNFVNTHDCEYCVYHVKQEYKKFTGRSEFQSQGGGALTNLRNKVLGKNEVFYAGQSFSALKPAKKSAKLVARDNKLLESLSKSGVMVSPMASQMRVPAALNSQTRGKKIEDAERMRRLTGEAVYVSSHKMPSDQEWNSKMTFKNIFQQTPDSPLQNKTVNKKTTIGDKSSSAENNNKPNKSANGDDIFDFESSHHLGVSKTPRDSPSNKVKKTNLNEKNGLKSSTSQSKVPDLNFQIHKSNHQNSKSNTQIPKSKNENPINSTPKSNTQSENYSIKHFRNDASTAQCNSSQLSLQESTTSQPSQAANNISNYFAKKSAAAGIEPSASRRRVTLSKDLRERKKQIVRAKAESLIKHKGGIEKVNPNSLKKNIIKVMNKSADFDLEIEGDKKDSSLDAFREMMQKKSRHMDLVDEAHQREEEEYFAKLEKKEAMEEKMLNTFKVECKAVRCVECKYTWFSASELCKRDRHTIKLIQTFKRFFKCMNCSNRTISFDVVPLRPCRHCGVTNWARAPMMKEKKVSMESQLSIRGGESKYLNSMSSGGDASLNLLVPE